LSQPWLLFLISLLLGSSAASAATYTYRSDAYSWESASTEVVWDRRCTSYPGDDDQATLSFSAGFTFPFAGSRYSSVRVLANGGLQFGADTGFMRTYSNTNLPAAASSTQGGGCAGNQATTNVILAYWTDLNPSQQRSGQVTWQQKGNAPNRYLVVSWNGVYQYNTSTPYTFQIILFENGEFKFQYGNANASGSQATIGVQVNTTDYTLYSYNSGYNANGSAIRWLLASSIGASSKVAEYRFDELAWTGKVGEVLDTSGNGYGGVRVGTASSVTPGVVCRALDVPANTNATVAGVDTALNIPNSVGPIGSIAFWYRGNTAWTGGADAQLLDASLSSGRSFHLVRRSNGTLRFALTDSGDSSLVLDSGAQPILATVWTHVTATWSLRPGSNQSVLRLYVNGILVGTLTKTSTGALSPTLGALMVGDNRAGITSNSATLNSANGRIDELMVNNYELSPAEILLHMAQTHDCAPPLHHLEIRHPSGTGVTCAPDALTIAACADAACSSGYTGGLAGSITDSSSAMVWPATNLWTILPGASTTTLALQLTSAGSSVLSLTPSGLSPTAATSCNFGSPACTYSAADAALLAAVSNHVSDTAQTLTVQAVRKADGNVNVCVPALAGLTRALRLSCSYVNPASGSLPLRVGGKALNAANNAAAACDATGQTLNLVFNALGIASTTLQYADVGQVDLGLLYTGSVATSDPGLSLAGSSRFIAAPASFSFPSITAGPIRAGTAFSATLRALNASGAATPNFGRESPPAAPTLSFSRAQPTGAGANDGIFSNGGLGAFSAGQATASPLVWSEVGRGDLAASLANYLGSGLAVAGSTGTAGAVGRFVPHHFDVSAVPACGVFSYAGQPFRVTVTAKNGLASPGTTLNYDGSAGTSPNFAQATSLSETALGTAASLSGGSLAASLFRAGVASSSSPAVAYVNKLSAPQNAVLRAIDADSVSSAGFAEAAMPLRSGRLRLYNALGSEKQALTLPIQLQYWSGQAWLLNAADSCTLLPASAISAVSFLDHKGQASSAWATGLAGLPSLSSLNGQTSLSLAAPPAGKLGSVDLSINLGNTAADQSCLASHPASTGAGLPWLRAQNGACATGWASDPSARASFGIYSAETRKTVHVREIF
jgi:MSHA biogenesis protein MshQ